jgi:protein disulfide-isomerase A6
VNDLLQARLGGKGGSSGGGGGGGGSGSGSGGGGGGKGGGGGGGGGKGSGAEPGGGRNVIELTEENFDRLVLESDDVWMVEFYAPWCGHCKVAAPEYSAAADELAGDAKVGAVDATVHEGLAQRFGVRGFPTFKVFPAGAKNGDSSAEDYNGARESSEFVKFLQMKLHEGGAAARGAVELTGQDVLQEKCGSKRLCLVAFLPDLLDDRKAGRDARLQTLNALVASNKRAPVRLVWAAQNAQPDLEKALDVAGLYPRIVALSLDKKVFVKHTGSFDPASLERFLAAVLSGRATPSPLPEGGLPRVRSVTPWDGADAAPAELPAEEFSLQDILGEEL